jgi:hypothetical protein
LALFGNAQKAVAAVAGHTPEQQAFWRLFYNQYERLVDKALSGKEPTYFEALTLKKYFIEYAQAIGLDGETLQKIETVLNACIDTLPKH